MTRENPLRSPVDPLICRSLEKVFEEQDVRRPRRISRYDAGHVFDFPITGVSPATEGGAVLEVEKCVGGGFAGQVYRARLIEISWKGEPVPDLIPGKVYAVKILVPPKAFSLWFRNLVYGIGYQAPFAMQVNESAARAGLLWQKMIRRAAGITLGSEKAVADTYASFFDPGIGSFGEINEWVEGHPWRYETDERIFSRRKWLKNRGLDPRSSGSPEYVAKHTFMRRLVEMLREMGAGELARQYEWWTAKSQPNVLKRVDASDGPSAGLTAIDFRAGLALLPFLPMSPVDFKLIVKGLFRGRLVQFDRPDLKKFKGYIDAHSKEFEDFRPAIDELLEREREYRASQPDVTRQGFRLLVSRKLRDSVVGGLSRSWERLGAVDTQHGERLRKSRLKFAIFFVIGLVPFLGKFLRTLWGDTIYRNHIKAVFTERGYLGRALAARQSEILTDWYRTGRVPKERVFGLLKHPVRFWLQRYLILGFLPPSWHRFLSEPRFAWTAVKLAVGYPIKFLVNREFREEWLREIVAAGYREGMLTDEERERVLAHIEDPFIQKYLKCVGVHLCTLPITQVVSLIVAVGYMYWTSKPWTESWATALLILAVFQGLPVSPGSLCRGSYVVYLMIRERNLRDYWVAGIVSFWHYIGYLGFPLQMVTKFPGLAQYLAGRWATGMVRIVPVFGEKGALAEHYVFDAFFNVPLSLWRLIRRPPQ